MAGAWRGGGSGVYRDKTLSIQVRGLVELQKAFRQIGGDLPKMTRRALREIAEPVRVKAKANVQHKTGRHGDPNLPPLTDTIRISARGGSVSVYSDQIYAAIQDQGGRVGHGALITRANASHYMTRAVQQSQAEVETALGHLGDTIANEFEGG